MFLSIKRSDCYVNVKSYKSFRPLTGIMFFNPKAEEKTYTATEIGNMLNVSAHKIGRLANTHKLKTAEYGSWYHDKAKHSGKEVETFRYNAKAINKFRQILHCVDTDSETAELVDDIVIIAE